MRGERRSSGTCQAMSRIIIRRLKIALKMTELEGGGKGRAGVGDVVRDASEHMFRN